MDILEKSWLRVSYALVVGFTSCRKLWLSIQQRVESPKQNAAERLSSYLGDTTLA